MENKVNKINIFTVSENICEPLPRAISESNSTANDEAESPTNTKS